MSNIEVGLGDVVRRQAIAIRIHPKRQCRIRTDFLDIKDSQARSTDTAVAGETTCILKDMASSFNFFISRRGEVRRCPEGLDISSQRLESMVRPVSAVTKPKIDKCSEEIRNVIRAARPAEECPISPRLLYQFR